MARAAVNATHRENEHKLGAVNRERPAPREDTGRLVQCRSHASCGVGGSVLYALLLDLGRAVLPFLPAARLRSCTVMMIVVMTAATVVTAKAIVPAAVRAPELTPPWCPRRPRPPHHKAARMKTSSHTPPDSMPSASISGRSRSRLATSGTYEGRRIFPGAAATDTATAARPGQPRLGSMPGS